jgi:hypothetical protein
MYLHGFASVSLNNQFTFGDLRRFVEQLSNFGVADGTEVEYDRAGLYVMLVDTAEKRGKVTFIECAEHMADDPKYDILIETHDHDEPKPKHEYKPGWDWVRDLILPEGDKYGDERRPE